MENLLIIVCVILLGGDYYADVRNRKVISILENIDRKLTENSKILSTVRSIRRQIDPKREEKLQATLQVLRDEFPQLVDEIDEKMASSVMFWAEWRNDAVLENIAELEGDKLTSHLARVNRMVTTLIGGRLAAHLETRSDAERVEFFRKLNQAQ